MTPLRLYVLGGLRRCVRGDVSGAAVSKAKRKQKRTRRNPKARKDAAS